MSPKVSKAMKDGTGQGRKRPAKKGPPRESDQEEDHEDEDDEAAASDSANGLLKLLQPVGGRRRPRVKQGKKDEKDTDWVCNSTRKIREHLRLQI